MHFHYFLVTLSLMFRKLDISLFLCIWNFCVVCFFNVEFGYPRSVGLSGTLRLAFGKKLFGKGGTRSSQRSQEATLLDGAHGAFFAGTAEKPIQIPHFGPSVSMFSNHTLQVQYARLNWGAVPPIYWITVHTISENVRAPFQVPLPVFLKSSDWCQYHPFFFRSTNFAPQTWTCFNNGCDTWNLEPMSSTWMRCKWFRELEHGHRWMIDWGK